MNQCGPELHMAQVQTRRFVCDLMMAKECAQVRLAIVLCSDVDAP